VAVAAVAAGDLLPLLHAGSVCQIKPWLSFFLLVQL